MYVFRELTKEDLIGKTIKSINRPEAKNFKTGNFSQNVLLLTFEDGTSIEIWSKSAEDKHPYVSTKLLVFEEEKHEQEHFQPSRDVRGEETSNGEAARIVG